MDGLAPHDAAAVEALEEAGVRGIVSPSLLGGFSYLKVKRSGDSQMMRVDLFPLAVEVEEEIWQEQGERQRRWFSQIDAEAAVMEPELKAMILAFDPANLPVTRSPFARLLERIRRIFA